MTSFALAARVTHAAPTFDALYYATFATVIPVLFLSLAVQGNVYGDVLQALVSSAREREGRSIRRMFWALAWLVPVAAFAGEFDALYSLYRQRANGLDRTLVLVSTTYLLSGVFFAATATYNRAAQKRADEQSDANPPAPETAEIDPA